VVVKENTKQTAEGARSIRVTESTSILLLSLRKQMFLHEQDIA